MTSDEAEISCALSSPCVLGGVETLTAAAGGASSAVVVNVGAATASGLPVTYTKDGITEKVRQKKNPECLKLSFLACYPLQLSLCRCQSLEETCKALWQALPCYTAPDEPGAIRFMMAALLSRGTDAWVTACSLLSPLPFPLRLAKVC